MKQGMAEHTGFVGELEMISTDRRDNSIIDHYADHNVITAAGINGIIRRLSAANDSNGYLFQFAIGNDVGSGNLFDPQPESKKIRQSDQRVIYEVPATKMTFQYPEDGVIRLSTVLRGNEIMNLSQFSGEVDIRYTSASTRLRNGEIFSYKRFPVRALSYYVDIALAWSFKFFDGECDDYTDFSR